ncbi:tyrosine--tRNA ligase [Neolewinella lacunae]|uniref:Tyrosine--tRNA ligase n=1 Tax=Neolewinella lacunae TaxID=1517758 RepID=A0A923PF10_9BACT|nr:tyrosine--tRNA ligase [Neolewinella lacunae]MBC6992918.1 tyrosine--tRNA ligase [Neolewinella lacunae]MDN3633718.1 tyrosine--tRNA ligase [Neolewinella lacunae]
MDFIAELTWRGMLHQLTPGIEAHLAETPRKAYIGFDPTAPSMTIGNYVQIMLLTLWARAGHHPVVLFGGATGRIGDPSGKDKERQLKSYDEVDRNLAHQREQMFRLLAAGLTAGREKGAAAGAGEVAEGEAKFSVVNNYDFYQNMNVLDFLRDVGKTLTISYMMSKDSVQNRLESGMSFTEFSYQLLQGYDFQKLYQEHGVTVQMGGSDQWGNITAGTEFVRRNLEGKAYAVTTPLLTKADGTKFGKSEGGNIWLDPDLTSPYDFYQFWIRSNDADIPTYLKYFSLRSKEEILADCATLKRHLAGDDQFSAVSQIKLALAAELTDRVHGPSGLATAQRVTNLLYGRGATADDLRALDAQALGSLAGEIPTIKLTAAALDDQTTLLDFLAEHGVAASKSEAKRALQGNAIAINKEKVSDPEATLSAADLLHERFMLVENGKKNRFLVVVG